MTETSALIVCPHCDTVNRLPKGRPTSEAKCGNCHQPIFTGQPVSVSAKSFEKHLRNDAVPLVVDFWAAWCGPCKYMAPVFAAVAAEMEPDIRFLKVDTEAEQQLAAHYQIRSIPTLMMFRDGKIVAQSAGAMDANALRNWIRQNAGALNRTA
jgi:thioredoxin 2